MTTRAYQSLSRPDGMMLSAFKKIDAELNLSGASKITVHVADGVSRDLECLVSELDASKEMAVFNGNSAVANWLHQTYPDHPYNGSWVRTHRQPSGFDKVQIEFPNNMDPMVAAKFIAAIQKHIVGFETAASVQQVFGAELNEFFAKREASLLRLEDLSQRLIEQNEQYRKDLDEKLSKDRLKIEEEKKVFLEEVKKENDSRDAAVKAREEELNARAKELDDRASRHVRRQIRKDFLEKLASREKQFALSGSTNSKRSVIHFQFGFLLLISAAVIANGLIAVVDAPRDIYAYGRLLFGAVGIAASTIYYIRWSDSWFRQHADEEFRLQRLALDFERASWVVEMALEWKQEKGEDIPHDLIERLTANLFSSGASSEVSRHPAEDLAAALLGASANVKLNVPGGELNLDRKGIQRLGG